jgi:hypothetical protein
MAKEIDFKEITLRLQTSHRGGGIEIDLTRKGFKGAKMTAYQNYLGGGLLGRIENDCTIDNWSSNAKLVKISEKLKRYFHELTNPSDDEWESQTYEENQNMPTSAY